MRSISSYRLIVIIIIIVIVIAAVVIAFIIIIAVVIEAAVICLEIFAVWKSIVVIPVKGRISVILIVKLI